VQPAVACHTNLYPQKNLNSSVDLAHKLWEIFVWSF
jgi:hypothetical protein